jgi:cytochrome P450
VSYDPLGLDVLADPFPSYADLREHCPVHHYDRFTPPFFTLSRYDDVIEALRDVETWSMRYGPSPQYTRPSGLVNDPPEHTEFRRLFHRGFTPRTVGGLEDEITALAVELLDAMAPLGRGDFHEHYAVRLPITVIARMLGVPEADHVLFKDMTDTLVATYNEPDPRASAAPRARFDAYFQRFIDERRDALRLAGVDHPDESHLDTVIPNDMVSGFVVAEYQGRRLQDPEIHWVLLLLLLGGNETSTALLTNMLWRLLEDRTRWEDVQADEALVDVAIEESLRRDPPVLGLFRTATHDVERHGVTIPHKAKVMLCYASANHDPSVFDDPDTYRLDRDLDEIRPHLSFGHGHHYCPGAALARLEARITLRLLIERFPRLRLDGVPTRIVPFNLWGRATLPVAWD